VPSLAHKRGTRAQIDGAAALNGLRTGELYMISDEARVTVATAVNAHSPAAKQTEGDQESWIKLAADVATSGATMTNVTGMSFNAIPNTTYVVDVVGTFQTAAITTGIALALAIPSGNVSGQVWHPVSATTANSVEQIASGATTGATTGVRAAATNVPVTASFIVAVGATGGAVQLQFRSEVAGSSVTIKAGLTAMGRRVV
jgi:hypothetical protein